MENFILPLEALIVAATIKASPPPDFRTHKNQTARTLKGSLNSGSSLPPEQALDYHTQPWIPATQRNKLPPERLTSSPHILARSIPSHTLMAMGTSSLRIARVRSFSFPFTIRILERLQLMPCTIDDTGAPVVAADTSPHSFMISRGNETTDGVLL